VILDVCTGSSHGAVDLIGIGECMVEFHASTSLGDASILEKSFGGDVLNTLVHAARNGLRTAFVTQVGNDPFGDYLIRCWQSEGVDTSWARMVEGVNGVYFISVDSEGERQFTYRRAGSAAARMSPDALDTDFLKCSGTVFVSGISQAISASAAAVVERAVASVGDDVRLVYDPNFRPALWDEGSGLHGARDAYRVGARGASWVLPSYPADVPLVSDCAPGPREALRLFTADCPRVAMKMGGDGVLMSVHGVESEAPAARVERVIDTTGAGDAWNGAFMAALQGGAGALEAAALANAYAGGTLAFRGAIPPRSAAPMESAGGQP